MYDINLQVFRSLQDSHVVVDIHGAVVEDIRDVVVEDILDEEDAGDNVAVVEEADTLVVRAVEDVVHVVDTVGVVLLLLLLVVVAVVAEEGSQHLTSPSSSPEPPARS